MIYRTPLMPTKQKKTLSYEHPRKPSEIRKASSDAHQQGNKSNSARCQLRKQKRLRVHR